MPSSTPPLMGIPYDTSLPRLDLGDTSFPSTQPPPLLHASSARSAPNRKPTPALKIALPSVSNGPSGYSSGNASASSSTSNLGVYSYEDGDTLRTPLARVGAGSVHMGTMSLEDNNPTLQARNNDDGGESAYGYGMWNNGLRARGAGADDEDAMTAALKEAVSRYGGVNSPNPSIRSRSRANSNVNSINSSRRGSATNSLEDDLSALKGLSIATPSKPRARDFGDRSAPSGSSTPLDGRRSLDSVRSGSGADDSFDSNGDVLEPIDPSGLELIRRLGEGTGGSVDLVRDTRTGRVMAKKVSSILHFSSPTVGHC